MLYVLGLSGKKGSGKSTASYIIKQILSSSKNIIVHELSFAGPLKRMITDIFCLTDECYDPNKKEIVLQDWGISPRELMQKIGTEMFRNEFKHVCNNINLGKYDSIWVASMNKRINDIYDKHVKEEEEENNNEKHCFILIDDCRYEDEYCLIKEFTNGNVIRIERPDLETENHCLSHSSEFGCSYDYKIKNTSLILFEKELREILRILQFKAMV